MSISNLPYVRKACAAIQDISNNNRVSPETGLYNIARIQRELDTAARELRTKIEGRKETA